MFRKSKKNKRRHARLQASCLVKYSKVDAGSDEYSQLTNAKDLSEGGLSVVSFESIPVSAILKLSVKLPFQEKPVETYGKVTRCVRVSREDEVYRIGLAFLDIKESDRQEIAKHVSDAGKHHSGKQLLRTAQGLKFWRKRKPINVTHRLKGVFFTID